MVRKLILLMVLLFWPVASCFADAAAQLEQAQQLEEQGKFAEAESLYKQVIGEAGVTDAGLAAHEGLVCLYVKWGKQEEADGVYEQMLADFAGHGGLAKAVDHVADAYRQKRLYADALERYQYAVDTWPQAEHAADAQRAVALTHFLLGDDNGAEAAIEKLLAEFGQHAGIAKVVDHLADDLRELCEYEWARDLYATVVDRWADAPHAVNCAAGVVRTSILLGDDPNAQSGVDRLLADFGGHAGVAKALDNIADEYRKSGSYERARAIYEDIVERWPGSDRAMESLRAAALCSIAQRDDPNAEAHLLELVSEFSGDERLADAVHDIVKEYRNVGAHEEGREIFNYLLTEWAGGDGTMLELQAGVAVHSIRLGELDEADMAVETLIGDYNDDPGIAEVLLRVAEEHYYANNYRRAVELLLLIDAEYEESQFRTKSQLPYVLATCARLLEQYDLAIEYYVKSIEKYPTSKFSSRAPYRIAWIRAEPKDDLEEAFYWFERQRELYPRAPSSSSALFHAGTIYVHELHDYENGAEVCQQYVDEYPNGINIWGSLNNLAICHEKLGNTGEAITLLQRLLEMTESESLRDILVARLSRLQEGGGQ